MLEAQCPLLGNLKVSLPLQALADLRAPDTPATPQSFIVQGGLASFEVAQDLLYLDFSQPEHAPQEFRMLSYNPERTTSLRSGISGVHMCWCSLCIFHRHDGSPHADLL